MTRLIPRNSPPRKVWQLEQQGVPPLLARLYAARGVETAAELDCAFKSLLPPSSLTHAAAAARLLADAIEAEARILIVADYDCDGATACAVGIRALRAFGATVDFLVPDRFVHGYGLSPSVVELATKLSPDLIVTVDNGIASNEGVALANELGIAVLVTDHHLPGETLPEAECIVNPNQPGCAFESKCIAGVGVMFYVMLALRAELRSRGWFAEGSERTEFNLATLLDLVALGTVADVVKLDRNNRILVSQGLKRMREGRMTPGIAALFRAAGREAAKASAFDLGFLLGPRLNAAGRLSDMSLGIECLTTDDPARALNIAQQLDALNKERREIESGMQEKALALVEAIDVADTAAISLFDPGWHQGVVGIVASRIKDKLNRPVFAFAPADPGQADSDLNAELRGSGRSIPGFHLRDALDLVSKRAPGLLLKFGGHAAAAGATIRAADFPRFQALFAEIAGDLLDEDALTRSLHTDGPLEAGYFSLETARLLESAIWGQGFPPPLFEGRFVVEQQRVLKDKHLKLRLRSGQQRFDAIQFNFSFSPGSEVHAVYRLAINEYNGVENVQLMIEHLMAPPDTPV
jgi:single-stranded-DNA-specific exonuclease